MISTMTKEAANGANEGSGSLPSSPFVRKIRKSRSFEHLNDTTLQSHFDEKCESNTIHEVGRVPQVERIVADCNVEQCFKDRLPRRSLSSNSLVDDLNKLLVDESIEKAEARYANKTGYLVHVPGVCSVPIFHTLNDLDDDLPPTPPWKGALGGKRSNSFTSRTAEIVTARAVVTLGSPHNFLMVSSELRRMLECNLDSEICGRSIKEIMSGPYSDFDALASAIRGTALLESSSINLVICPKIGKDKDVTASFSPYYGADKALSGCLIEFIHRKDCSQASSNSSTLLSPDSCL